MEFVACIKQIVNDFGAEKIAERSFVGLLDDYCAFDDEPASVKRIIRFWSDSQQLEKISKILNDNQWRIKASDIIHFSEINGFDRMSASEVLHKMLLGIGVVTKDFDWESEFVPKKKAPLSQPSYVSTPTNQQKPEEKNESGFFSRLAGLFGGQQKTSLSADDCYQKAIDAKNSNNAKDYLDWLQKAAKKNSAKACLALGSYYSGNNAAQDYEEALKWYKKGVSLGDETCSINLGFMYAYGQGIVADYNKALACFEAPAKAGNQRAQFGMGYCNYRLMTQLYDKQQTVTVGSLKCYNEAKRWLTYVAEKGNADAQYYLGTIYNLEGFSSESRHELRKKSYEWLDKARKQGHKGASEYINRFGSYYWRS